MMVVVLLIKMAVVVKSMATIMMMMMVLPADLFAKMVMMVMFCVPNWSSILHDVDVVDYDNDNLRASQVCGRKQLEGTIHHDLLWVSDKGNFEVSIIMIFSYNAGL